MEIKLRNDYLKGRTGLDAKLWGEGIVTICDCNYKFNLNNPCFSIVDLGKIMAEIKKDNKDYNVSLITMRTDGILLEIK